MRKVLAVASVGIQHKELILKDLAKKFKKIRIPLQILLQEEFALQSPQQKQVIFSSYPYITLTIPNYQEHRDYLENIYRSNVLFNKFILLISNGNNYQELIQNKRQDIIREECRSWQENIDFHFDSTPVLTSLENQLLKINNVFQSMDIRGKISKIQAEKKLHLIQLHHNCQQKVLPKQNPNLIIPDPNDNCSDIMIMKQIFFGIELGKVNKVNVGKSYGRKSYCGSGSRRRWRKDQATTQQEENQQQEQAVQKVQAGQKDSALLALRGQLNKQNKINNPFIRKFDYQVAQAVPLKVPELIGKTN